MIQTVQKPKRRKQNCQVPQRRYLYTANKQEKQQPGDYYCQGVDDAEDSKGVVHLLTQ